MFSKTDFQTWASNSNVVPFASVMTRIPGRKDDDLLRTYGFTGFPSFAILDAEGKVLTKKVGRSLDGMQSAVKTAADFVKLKAEVAAGKGDKAKLFLKSLDLGQLDLEAAKAQRDETKLDPAQAKQVDAAIFGMELQSLMAQARQDQDGVAEKIYAFYKDGKKPAAGSREAGFFNALLLHAADKKKDGEAFLVAFSTVESNVKRQIAQYKGALKRFKKSGNDRAIQSYENAISQLEGQLKSLQDKAAAFQKK